MSGKKIDEWGRILMDLGFCQLIKRSSKRFRAGDVLLMYDEQKSFLTKPNWCHKHTRHKKVPVYEDQARDAERFFQFSQKFTYKTK